MKFGSAGSEKGGLMPISGFLSRQRILVTYHDRESLVATEPRAWQQGSWRSQLGPARATRQPCACDGAHRVWQSHTRLRADSLPCRGARATDFSLFLYSDKLLPRKGHGHATTAPRHARDKVRSTGAFTRPKPPIVT